MIIKKNNNFLIINLSFTLNIDELFCIMIKFSIKSQDIKKIGNFIFFP